MKANQLLDTPYYYISRFFNNRAVVKKLNENNELVVNLIDNNFNEIFEDDYSSIRFANNKNYLIIGKKSEKEEFYGLYALDGRELFAQDYTYIDINNDEIVFIKEKNNQEHLLENLYKEKGYLKDLKDNTLFEFNNADGYFMINDFIITSYTLSKNENQYGGEILFYDKKLSKVVLLTKFDYISYLATENNTYVDNAFIFTLNNRYYLWQCKKFSVKEKIHDA